MRRLNYVLFFLVISLSMRKAQEDNYDEEMHKFMEIYGKPNADDQAKADNLPYFVDFLNRYSDRIPVELKALFKDFKVSLMIPDDDTQMLVDGVPMQGGGWGNFLADLFYALARLFASLFGSNE